jgi:hypothetical protein
MSTYDGGRRGSDVGFPAKQNTAALTQALFASAEASFQLERWLPGRQEEVWAFLTNSDQIERFLDCRQGAALAGGCGGELCYSRPPRLLTFNWSHRTLGPRLFLVTIELLAVGDMVRLLLTVAPRNRMKEAQAHATGQVDV